MLWCKLCANGIVVKVLVGNITRLVGLLMPIVTVAISVLAILKWDQPLNSFAVLCIWVGVCQWFGYIPAMLCSSLVVYMMSTYISVRSRKAALESLHAVVTAMEQNTITDSSDAVVWEQQDYHKQARLGILIIVF